MGNNRKYSHSPPFLKGTSFSKELKGQGVRNIPSWRGQLQRPSGHRPPGSVLTTCASAKQWQLAFATLRWAGGSFIRSSCSSRIRCSSGNWLKLDETDNFGLFLRVLATAKKSVSCSGFSCSRSGLCDFELTSLQGKWTRSWLCQTQHATVRWSRPWKIVGMMQFSYWEKWDTWLNGIPSGKLT